MDSKDLRSRWTLAMRAEGATRATVKTRTGSIGSLARHVDPATATTGDVREWLAEQRTPWTVVTYYASAKAWFAFLAAEGFRDDDPMTGIRRPRSPRGVPHPISDDDLRHVVAVTTGDVHAYVVLAAYAGLRVSEVARVKGEDVSQLGLRVRGKGNRVDVVPTHPLIWSLAQRRPRRGWWFPSPASTTGHVSGHTVSTTLSRLFAELGIDATAHALRHAFITRCYRASGHDLLTTQLLARHASPTQTAGYALVESDRGRETVLGLDTA